MGGRVYEKIRRNRRAPLARTLCGHGRAPLRRPVRGHPVPGPDPPSGGCSMGADVDVLLNRELEQEVDAERLAGQAAQAVDLSPEQGRGEPPNEMTPRLPALLKGQNLGM